MPAGVKELVRSDLFPCSVAESKYLLAIPVKNLKVNTKKMCTGSQNHFAGGETWTVADRPHRSPAVQRGSPNLANWFDVVQCP